MAIKTLEYCSLRYLNLWLSTDSGCHECLRTTDDSDEDCKRKKQDALIRAAKDYRVARNFPTRFETGKESRYEPVLNVLNQQIGQGSPNQDDVVQRVLQAASDISSHYGHHSKLSATSKFMWLLFKDPVVIYDSQARQALGTKNGDYAEFYKRWMTDYRVHERDIQRVCAELPSLYLYSKDTTVGNPAYVESICNEPWFHKRVFDLYLWGHEGKKLNR